MLALIMGVRVSATKADNHTADAITTPNSRKSRPVTPSRKTIGENKSPFAQTELKRGQTALFTFFSFLR